MGGHRKMAKCVVLGGQIKEIWLWVYIDIRYEEFKCLIICTFFWGDSFGDSFGVHFFLSGVWG